jgi:secreted PhoX family phosphatase
MTDTSISRRSFIRTSTVAGVGAASMLTAFDSFNNQADAALADGGTLPAATGYGPLKRMKPAAVFTDYPGAADIEWLALPEGFQYTVMGVTGDVMDDGNVTPSAHDGMTCVRRNGRTRLIRNHEDRNVPGVPFGHEKAYDPIGGGGCTTLDVVFRNGIPTLSSAWVSLNGTYVNCAGGNAWNNVGWISSEETTGFLERRHGYNFLVPAWGRKTVDPVALTDMGRFPHEGVATNTSTGVVYQTEDNGDSGLYQFVPNKRWNLAAGGDLYMLRVKGEPNANLKTGPTVGQKFVCDWVPIPDPDPDTDELERDAIKNQGLEQGAALFGRLEGCWWANGSLWFACTNGGVVEEGQIWRLQPKGNKKAILTMFYESPSGLELSAPDNITISPRGGILIAEDHGFDRPDDPFVPLPNVDPEDSDDFMEVQYLKGLTRRGELFDFAANLLDDKEWTGPCFSPDGRVLFANTQGTTRNFDPSRPQDFGRTYAIWGPWGRGLI